MTKQNKVKNIKLQKGEKKNLSKNKIDKQVEIKVEKNDSNKTKEDVKIEINKDDIKQVKERDIRLPAVGTIMTRKYKGQEIKVKVLEKGFEYQDKIYKSISSLAVAIVGCPISGYVFFKLGNKNVKYS